MKAQSQSLVRKLKSHKFLGAAKKKKKKDKNQTKDLYRYFTKEDAQVVKKHMRTRSISQITAAAAAKSLQSLPTLCDPIDGSPPGSPVPGILQARTLE